MSAIEATAPKAPTTSAVLVYPVRTFVLVWKLKNLLRTVASIHEICYFFSLSKISDTNPVGGHISAKMKCIWVKPVAAVTSLLNITSA